MIGYEIMQLWTTHLRQSGSKDAWCRDAVAFHSREIGFIGVPPDSIITILVS
jgi:hypothetical protein